VPPPQYRPKALWRSSSRPLVASVGVITVVGLLLRLPSFGDSLFGDELSTYFIVTGHSLGRINYLLQGHSVDLNPPLFFALAWMAERFGDGASALRIFSLVAGTAVVPLTYLLGVRTVGRRAALVAAALTALSPFLIFFSSEARGYALSVLFVLMCTLALLQALDTQRVHWWVAYALSSGAAIYTHYVTVFFLATLFVWAFWTQPAARGRLLAANAGAAIAYLPWLPTLLRDTRSPGNKVISFLEPFSPNLVRTFLGRSSIGHPLIPLASLPGAAAIAAMIAGLAAGVAGVALNIIRADRVRGLPRVPARTLLILLLALGPPAEIALYSAIGNSVWESRNLIAALPAWALVVGALLTSGRGVLRALAVGLVIVGFAIAAAKMLDPSYRRPDFGAAVNYIDRVGASGDPVIDLPPVTPGPLTEVDTAFALAGRASRERHSVLRLGYPSLSALLSAPPYAGLSPTPPDVVAQRAEALARGHTLFVVGLQGEATSFLTSLSSHFRVVRVRTFPGFYPVAVYAFRDALTRAGVQHNISSGHSVADRASSLALQKLFESTSHPR
jgi:hypothetical protein